MKLVPGQVGRPDTWYMEEPYQVSFYDENLIKLADEILDPADITERVFTTICVDRDELLELNTTYNQISLTNKTVDISKNLKQEKDFSVIDISTFDIQPILKKAAEIINADLKQSFQPGNLVIVTADFIEEKDDSFKIKIRTGYIGIILNAYEDTIIDENTQTESNIQQFLEKKLEEDEIVVYFGELHLWHFFDLSQNNYHSIAPFEKNNCYIVNKAFLLPLCFKKHLFS